MPTAPPPYVASDRARALHERLWVADLHADSLLWGRDLLVAPTAATSTSRGSSRATSPSRCFAASTKSPRHLNIERNDDSSDDVILLALALGWPPATWRRLLPRALHMAARADAHGRPVRGPLDDHPLAGGPGRVRGGPTARPGITAGLLAIEGAHALDDDPANVEVVADAGFRMMSPSHFFDNAFGGSAHGIDKGGLTDAGREMVRRMEARGMLRRRRPRVGGDHRRRPGDGRPARSSPRTPASAASPTTPGTCPTSTSAAIAATGGLVGIGFWPTACGGEDVEWIARSIRYAVDVAGVEHVGLGSDFDGAVPTPFDATGLVQLTDALLDAGLDDDAIAKVMGGNVRRLLAETCPPPDPERRPCLW